MKILVLSYFYKPDLSPGSFRTTALIAALRARLPVGAQVNVVTTSPHRYSTFRGNSPEVEVSENVEIHRVQLPSHNRGMVGESRAFFHFAKGVLAYTRSRQYSLVVATSGRLMTAALGALVARQQNAKLYLDIRDIFADNMKYVLPFGLALLAQPMFSLLERWTIARANKVNLVSRGFQAYFEMRYPKQQFTFFPHGIDDEFIDLAKSSKASVASDRRLTVLYAGNMGEGQGLHAIIPNLAKRMSTRLVFKLIGDGSRKHALQVALAREGVDNVELLHPVKRSELIRAYQNADILFMQLNDYDSFKTVLPSKLFEYAAMGKPIWAGVSGYPAEFIRAEISNAAVFHPGNVEEAEAVFSHLAIVDENREGFVKKFARVSIMREMADDIMSLGKDLA